MKAVAILARLAGLAAPFGGLACDEESTRTTDPIVTPCEQYCAAAAATEGCEGAAGDCRSTCEAFQDGLERACRPAYDRLFECLREGDFTCEGDVAVPDETRCVPAALDVQRCEALGPCHAMCDRAVEQGCPPHECLTICATRLRGSCESALFFECLGEHGECAGGELHAPSSCRAAAYRVARCELPYEPCEGYCRAAFADGCVATPGACQLACEANLADPACGLEAGAAFACRVEEGFACDIGLPADCASLEQSLAECLARASN